MFTSTKSRECDQADGSLYYRFPGIMKTRLLGGRRMYKAAQSGRAVRGQKSKSVHMRTHLISSQSRKIEIQILILAYKSCCLCALISTSALFQLFC